MFSPQFKGEQKQFWGTRYCTEVDISLLSSSLGLARSTKRKSSISVHIRNGSDCGALTGSPAADKEGGIFTWTSSRCSHFNVISHLLRRMCSGDDFHDWNCSVHCPSHILDEETGILSSSWKSYNQGSKIILVSEVLSLLVRVVLVVSVTQQAFTRTRLVRAYTQSCRGLHYWLSPLLPAQMSKNTPPALLGKL